VKTIACLLNDHRIKAEKRNSTLTTKGKIPNTNFLEKKILKITLANISAEHDEAC